MSAPVDLSTEVTRSGTMTLYVGKNKGVPLVKVPS